MISQGMNRCLHLMHTPSLLQSETNFKNGGLATYRGRHLIQQMHARSNDASAHLGSNPRCSTPASSTSNQKHHILANIWQCCFPPVEGCVASLQRCYREGLRVPSNFCSLFRRTQQCFVSSPYQCGRTPCIATTVTHVPRRPECNFLGPPTHLQTQLRRLGCSCHEAFAASTATYSSCS